jgi:hypothetical protein
MEYRPYYLAREWVRLGHNVQIVASGESHVRAVQPELAGRDRLHETIDGIQYGCGSCFQHLPHGHLAGPPDCETGQRQVGV